MAEIVIATNKITKYYGAVHAVEDVSLNVAKGDIYGFLGLNGAGKTTTIHILLGMTRPTRGIAFINGQKVDVGNYRLWERVGYFVETPHAYPALSVFKNLEITRRLYGVSDSKAVDRVMDRLRLTALKDRKAKTLSMGNAQRLGLARALIHNPNILFLDEPTNGLDPVGIVEVRELLLDMAYNQNITIFISSHNLAEISKIANRIGIIHQGRMIKEVETNKIKEENLEAYFFSILKEERSV